MKRFVVSILLISLIFGLLACAGPDPDEKTEPAVSEEPTSDTGIVTSESPDEGDAQVMTAMSFNVLINQITDERVNAVIGIITKYMPDTIGFQEADWSWINRLKGGLPNTYSYVGEGRDGGKSGEFSPVFYNKNVFKLISSGTKWLSDTPDKVSKFPDAYYNRVITYAILERKSDQTRILVCNTHLDHKSSDVRLQQAKVINAFLSDYSDMPVILTGDFNSQSGTAAFQMIVKADLTDSSTVAKVSSKASTFTSFGTKSSIIDFIFVRKSAFNVASYKVCNEKINGVIPSDHHPVLIEYTVKK